MIKEVKEVVQDYDNIYNLEQIKYEKCFRNKVYEYVYKFIVKVNDENIPIVMGIPNDWDRKLIDIYIENYKDIVFIPHMDNKGKLCLFELEGVLIHKNFKGLLNQSLLRMNKVLVEGISGSNKKDFIEEFENYWLILPGAKNMKSMIELTDNIKVIKYADNKVTRKKKKKEKYIDILKNNNMYNFIVSDKEKDFTLYKDMNEIKNAVYINIISNKYIYPPDWRKELSLEYINMLVNYDGVNKELLYNCIKKCKKDLLIVFNINQNGKYSSIFGVMIEKYNVKYECDKLMIISDEKLVPCYVSRCDYEYLVNRGGANYKLKDKKILIIGCGSIGGYLTNEMVKAGFNDITVIDNDLLHEENIYRHLLGLEYIEKYKSKALEDYIKKNIPNVNIKSIQDTIEDSLIDGNISLSDYDLILSAIGNHNGNRWLNGFIYKNKINVPVIYLWNEVLGIGNHGMYICRRNKGCYECLFRYDDNGEIYDASSYCEKGQKFVKTVVGCGTAYLPYSSTNSLKTSILGVEMAIKYFLDMFNENYIISIKGDNFYFKMLGYRTSMRYNNQEQIKEKLEGEKFRVKDCRCCRGN
ncbi:MAG: ThiF family adenylyltransferase [Clostridium sp.]|uniref:ThiF family adenylyltransferase n=1 Tax=Clostridium sp. TaxID=1506 RepID=UPI002A91782C|nr:ThiF family adenylyltransferase [Clostridium sp.]MDY6228059.1 ThiF family adenylyltransferase [Clostridium sp.]